MLLPSFFYAFFDSESSGNLIFRARLRTPAVIGHFSI